MGRGGLSPWVRAFAGAALVIIGLAGPGAERAVAQEPPPVSEAQRERLLEKLRRADPAAQADSVASTDSTAVAAGGREAGSMSRGAAQPGRGRSDGPPALAFDRDSVMAALLTLEEYIATEYTGAGVRYSADSGRVELQGKAQIQREGQSMTADSLLVFDERTSVVCGYGTPVLSGEGSPVESDQVCYDLNRQLGTAVGARTTFHQGANWIVHGDRVYTVGSDRVYAHNALFTDCDLDEPHYHFSAGRVKIVNDDILVARDVTLNFRDVPVFWLPFMVQSMKSGRRSGLLTPRFGINDIARTSSSYNRRIDNIGFYWAINDYMGAEVALDWFANNWTALAGTFDYRWLRQFLNGAVTFQRYWRENGSTDFTVSTQNHWQPTERTSVVVSGSYASSSDFVRRNSFDPTELNRTIDSNASLSHRFDWGSVNLGASRRQHLITDQVDLRLPQVGVNLANVTLFRASPGQERWYNNASWTGSANFSRQIRQVHDTMPNVRNMDQITAGANSSFNLGKFSWAQQVSASQTVNHARAVLDPESPDSVLPREMGRTVSWSSRLNFQQRLIGTTTLTPSLALRGEMLGSEATGEELVAAPVRLEFGSDLRTDIFGFWPGVGPFSRIRHKISPSVSYAYSPTPSVTDRQREVFTGLDNIREQNRITLTLNQTFEAKFRSSETEEERQAGGSEAEAGEQTSDPAAADGEPRRLPQDRKMTLLSLSTSAIAYDFVKAREDQAGLDTRQISSQIGSDLLRGLQLGFTHDLFRPDSTRPGNRAFDLHLSGLNASFSVGSDSWLARLLGLGGGRGEESTDHGSAIEEESEDAALEEDPWSDSPQAGIGMVDRRRGMLSTGPRGSAGSWNASLNYMLTRPREGTGEERQMLNARVTLQPTEHWSVTWNTGYSITDGQFSDHILNLTRDLHDWEAIFSFVRAQNGNFSFQVNVRLRANPDLKFDYQQRGERAQRAF